MLGNEIPEKVMNIPIFGTFIMAVRVNPNPEKKIGRRTQWV